MYSNYPSYTAYYAPTAPPETLWSTDLYNPQQTNGVANGPSKHIQQPLIQSPTYQTPNGHRNMEDSNRQGNLTNVPGSVEQQQNSFPYKFRDDTFSTFFVTLTFLSTCVLVWSAWWAATALGEEPGVCSVKNGIPVPSSVSFAPAFQFKLHQVPVFFTSGGWPLKNSALRLTVSSLGVLTAFIWSAGVGRLKKPLARKLFLPIFATILALSVACIVIDANSLLSVKSESCPSGSKFFTVVSSLTNHTCSCRTGSIFWATLGILVFCLELVQN
eukprot:jgi/Galph1/5631/GphlegSOOS_G4230.1